MPCGQLDRRRVGHRCAPCKRSHIKCDGGRPCSSCVTRGSECTVSKVSSTFQFVPQGGPARIPRALIQDSWRYISTYFQALGPLMQASVLRSAAVTTLSHEDENVSRTLSIVGALYGCRNPQVLRINAKERRKIMDTWLRQRSVIDMELKKPETARFTPIFLSAMLLAVVELMLCHEEGRFQTWLTRISTFLKAYSKRQPVSAWTSFERDLVRFFKFLDILSAIARIEAPVEPQVLAEPWPARPAVLEPAGVTELSLKSRTLDGLLSAMWQWASLQPRILTWISGIEARKLLQQKEAGVSKEFIDLKVQGLDLVCEVTALQSRIIGNLIQLSEQPHDEVSASVSPYYNWALTGLSHMLQHDAWQSLMCDLPVMSAEVLHQQALAVLGHIEKMIDKLGLDLALFLPFADFVGWEMDTVAEKQRMLKFLDTVQSRGFDAAEEYRVYLLGNWQPIQQQPAEMFLSKVKGW